MRILHVRLTNLNSLQGRHEVDFEAKPLADAGLFAITGQTGSGKSTLLDAITLALYGRAARYGSTPSPENMMSRHCGECSAEVLFRVPSGTYRAEWQLRRARGKPTGQIQAAKRYVYDEAGQTLAQKVNDTEELIEKLIGLDYARFLRSAMLAQGEFAQFLKARPDERAELLESLTGTSIYSALGTLAHTEASRRENDLKVQESAIQEIQLLADGQREKLAGDIPPAEAGLEQAKQNQKKVTDGLNKAANLATALVQQSKALAEQLRLTTERKAAEADLQRLRRYQLTIPFHGDLARLDAATSAAKSAAGLLDQATLAYSRAQQKAGRCLRTFRQFVAKKIQAAEADIKAAEEKLKDAGRRKSVADKWLREHKNDQSLPDKITDLVSELANLKGTRNDLSREWTSLGKLAERLDRQAAEDLLTSADELTEARVETILARLRKLMETKQASAKTATKKAERDLKLREDHLEQARLVASFEEHRAGLKAGEPCPLCGAKEHPYAEGAEPTFPFKDLEQEVKKARDAFQKRSNEFRDLEQLQSDILESGRDLRRAIGDSCRVLSGLARQLKTFSVSAPPSGKEDETKSILTRRTQDYRQQAAALDKAGQDQEAAELARRHRDSALNTLKAKHSKLAAESLPEPCPDHAEPADMEQSLPGWDSVEAAEEDWIECRDEALAKHATLQNRQSDMKERGAQVSTLLSAMASRLAGSEFTQVDDLKAAQLAQAEVTRIESLEQALNARAGQLAAALSVAKEDIARWRKEEAPEGEAVDVLKAEQTALQAHHDQLIQNLALWGNQLKQDDANRLKVADKRKQLETTRQQLAVWLRLRGLIGSFDGRTFRRFAQGLSLDVLIHYANHHLFRLSDRYRLRRRDGEELDLEIEDLHQAGTVRPMASLSGGESFLASLALALGLSDIAGRNVRIESLFIDEGFGSLDSDTLDLAISALETLRQDSKTVGVISHVDLLKERIATQIVVEKHPGGVSSIRVGA